MSKSSKELITPIIMLGCICLVASFLLAGVFQITNPVILENAAKTASAARTKVLPEGDSFTDMGATFTDKQIVDCYKADNGAGYVITTKVKGMEAGLKVMVGIDSQGKVTGLSVLEHSETKGIGTKVLDQAYLDEKAIGLTSNDAFDGITGATYTSKGIQKVLDAAFAAYAQVK